MSTDVDVAGLDEVAASFEHAHPLDILRWADRHFGDELLVTASFGDAVLVHLVSQAIPDAEIVLLDTGYLFAETQWYAERLRTELGLNLRIVHPLADVSLTSGSTTLTAAARRGRSNRYSGHWPDRRAWITGLRRADSPTRSDAPIVHLDPFRGVTKINPLATWTDDRGRPLLADRVAPRASSGQPRLRVDRLLAVHPPGDRRRGCPGGAVGRFDEDGMRSACPLRTSNAAAITCAASSLRSWPATQSRSPARAAKCCSSSTGSTNRTIATCAGNGRPRSCRSPIHAWSAPQFPAGS